MILTPSVKKLKSKKKVTLPILPIIAILIFFLGRLLKGQGWLLERFYSQGVNKWVIQLISRITGIFPISLGEVIYVGHLLAIPVVAVLLLYKAFKGGLSKFLYNILQYICVVYIVFMLVWGMNYSRISIAEITGLELQTYTEQQLYQLNVALIDKGNELREYILQDDAGIMQISGGYKTVFSRADAGFSAAGESIVALAGSYGRPKAVLLSRPMLYTGITGMYFPFTAEANVNVATPDLLLPATVLHEMAHQRGFASEDEANYIAYLTASLHPDTDFQYSGTMLALIHSMNALDKQNPQMAAALREGYSDGLRRDLLAYSEFWREYEGKVNETANRMNDAYLKSNGQSEGTKSYGRMVDLLLAHLIKHGEI